MTFLRNKNHHQGTLPLFQKNKKCTIKSCSNKNTMTGYKSEKPRNLTIGRKNQFSCDPGESSNAPGGKFSTPHTNPPKYTVSQLNIKCQSQQYLKKKAESFFYSLGKEVNCSHQDMKPR